MKGLLTYYGGKQKLAPAIVELIPPDHYLYGEPFCGGAAVFWKKRPSAVEVLNDRNGELMNFYNVVRSQYAELAELIAGSLHSRKAHQHASIIYNYAELFSTVQRAWAIWVLSSQSFSAILDGTWGFDLTDGTTSKKIANSRAEFTELYSRRLEHVQLECADALYIIRSRDTPKSFFYVDPPYYNSDMGHYRGYTLHDYTQLLECLSKIQGRFLLSSYPSRVLAEYAVGYNWNQLKFEQTVSVNIKSGKGKPKTEVLTGNYPLVTGSQPLTLFPEF